MYAGCVSGAIDIDEYLEIINKQGFKNVTVHKQKEIAIPNECTRKIPFKRRNYKFQKW